MGVAAKFGPVCWASDAPGRHASMDGGNPWWDRRSAFCPYIILTPNPGEFPAAGNGSARVRIDRVFMGDIAPTDSVSDNVWACRVFE